MIEDAEFDALYIKYFPRMVRFAQHYLTGRDRAENAVQDVFLKLHENRDLIPAEGRDAWMLAVVRNKSIDILRKKHSSLFISLEEAKDLELKLHALSSLDDKALSPERINEMIHAGLDTLPPRCREVFTLSKIKGLSHKQISSELGISTSTVENQITIAFKKLKGFYKDYLPFILFFFI